jgi:rhodanese-related sulfurtransferase
MDLNRVTSWVKRIRSHFGTLGFIVLLTACGTASAYTNLTVRFTTAAWTNRHFEISLNGPLGYDYIVQASDTLLNWTPLYTNSPAAMPFHWADTQVPAQPARFYRVLASVHRSQIITNISPSMALALIQDHQFDSNFVILDVRTAAEYAARHITGALNRDFYSTTFREDLTHLDPSQTFLVYCASGNRSRQAVELMRQAGFFQVYSMLNGFGSFAALPGVTPFLEP